MGATSSSAVSAKLISTVGNHDLDSRFKANKYDPRGYAMSLSPTLPVAARQSYLEYWAENFTVLRFEDCNVAVLNTAAYHGVGVDIEREVEHGRISEITLGRLEQALKLCPESAVGILLCHHHPIKAEERDSDLEGVTRGGEALVRVLGELGGPWIVIHGHKHVPDLFYAHGGGVGAPVVLGCASFSAQVNRDAQNKNPNQVHLLVTDVAEAAALGLACAGEVHSWTWQAGIGWSKAHGIMGLPQVTGFGYKSSVKVLASKIDGHLSKLGVSHIQWSEAIAIAPEIRKLVPEDFRKFSAELQKLSIAILRDESGGFAQVGRSS
jgi:hypothetical protein